MKRAGAILSTLLLIILLGGFLYMKPLMPIITGYAAKNLSSGIFVGNRTQESLEATDLNFSFIRFVNNSVDTTRKTVSSRFLWHSSRTTFVNGYGSILVNDHPVGDIQARPYPVVPVLPANPDTIAWPMGNLIADTIPSDIDMRSEERRVGKECR